MAEKKTWYINSKSQTYGPYDNEEVFGLIREGIIEYSDYIFKEGFKGWEYLYNVPDFDRRLLNPGGGQPIVEIPKEAVSVDSVDVKQAESKDGEELWYVHDGESQIGPYTSNYIKEALDKKTVFWTYYVWRDGFDNWVQIKDCKEFDRRTKPRGDSPVGLDITTDYKEIKEKAVKLIPQAEGELYKATSNPANFQYGVSNLEQEELKGKYPVKAITILFLVAAALFGIIRAYPWLMLSIRENRAMNMYEKAVGLVEQKKYEEGFNLLTNLVETYPTTRAVRREKNYIRSKEPSIKSYLADEGRNIKKQIDEYIRIYGVLPVNSIDINYMPSFWMKDFGEIYYTKDMFGRTSVMVRGVRFPVDAYVFSSDSNKRETENDLTQQEFLGKSRNYTKLVYTGTRSNVRPVVVPRIRTSPVPRPVRPSLEAKPEEETVTRRVTKTPIKKPVSKSVAKPAKKSQEQIDEEAYYDQELPPIEDEDQNDEEYIDEGENENNEKAEEEIPVVE